MGQDANCLAPIIEKFIDNPLALTNSRSATGGAITSTFFSQRRNPHESAYLYRHHTTQTTCFTPPCKSETAEEAQARKAKLKPKALAALVGLSPSHLYPAFKAETEMTISQCVKEIRLAHASELLANTFLHVTEVAYQADYTDVYHFSRDFKRSREVSPTEYRRRNAENKTS